MIKAVLLDLDNTLLHNPDRQFSAAFRQRFDQHFMECYGIEGASDALRRGIRSLGAAPDGRSTNADIILSCLSDGLTLTHQAIAYALASFYDGAYNQLKALTAVVAGANVLVENLLNQNLLVAIATNPIYPETAILRRLDWAGLSSFVADFAFVSHNDNMHFAKPDAAYFAEVVARVGVEPDEALIIGDSLENDVEPARAIGLHAWQVGEENRLKTVVARVSKPDWQNGFRSRQATADMLYPQFQGNLAALYGLLVDVKEHQWLMRPDPAEWSILQILCHLWKAETDVHQQRLRLILDQDNPFISSQAPPGPHIPACHDNGIEVFERFRAQRHKTMDMLADLTPEDWKRPARHSIFGLTNLLEMSYFTAQHDRLHITQLCQTLGKCAD